MASGPARPRLSPVSGGRHGEPGELADRVLQPDELELAEKARAVDVVAEGEAEAVENHSMPTTASAMKFIMSMFRTLLLRTMPP